MAKIFSYSSAVLAALSATEAAVAGNSVNKSCSVVDFTSQVTQFLLLNNAVDVATQSTLLHTLVKDYDPLVLQNIDLGEFSYSILGQDLTFMPTLDRLNVTGLANVVPEHLNASSSNCVDIGADSDRELSIEATVSLTLEEIDTSITVDVSLTLDKPTLAANVQANMYGCAASAPGCDDFTVITIEVAGVDGKYSSIMDCYYCASRMQQFKLFHSSGAIISAITDALADFSADQVNNKGDAYDTSTSAINGQLLSVANDHIDSKLKPSFGATCIET